MPNITQAALDDLHRQIEDAQSALARRIELHLEDLLGAHDRDQRSEARIAQFDELLHKVLRATHGVPVLDHGRVHQVEGAYAGVNSDEAWRFDPRNGAALVQPAPPDPLQRSEAREAELRVALTWAESRLTQVRTVAEMALEHKA